MTMTAETAWAHLPNAQHIDAVLADVRKRPEVWDEAVLLVWGKFRHRLRDAARDVARDINYSAWEKAWHVTRDISQATPPDAMAALIAWDSSADLLECTPDVLRAMVDLAEPPVCHQAALLLPYAIVRFGQ